MNISKVLVVICLVFLSACEHEKEIPFTMPFEGVRLVVYGVLHDENHQIEVYRTQRSGYQSPPSILKNIEARMVDDIGNQVPFSFQNNKGNCDLALSSSRKYHVEVRHKDLFVTSETLSPLPKIAIDSVTHYYKEDSSEVNISLFFTDPPSPHNFYQYQYNLYDAQGEFIQSKKLDLRNLIHDTEFNGQSYSISIPQKITFPVFGENYVFLGVKKVQKIELVLLHISEHLHLFNQSIQSQDQDFSSQFVERPPPYSNIKEGYGYFVGMASDTAVVDL